MWKKIATTAFALAALALAPQAGADDWWDDDDDDRGRYRHAERDYDRDYERDRRQGRYRHATYDRGGEYVYADVVDVEPLFRTVRVRRPERECWDEEVYDDRRRRHSTAPATIAGGLIGGAVGRQFGDGKGRDAMTVVGTLIGSAIANDRATQRHYDDYDRPRVRVVERCETHWQSYDDRRLEGYRVTYVYGGREYTTRTAHEPGDRIRVNVAVTPVHARRW